jgi:hypothetical protein
MPADNVEALVDETKALIREVEGGETVHAAWVAIQDRIKQLNKVYSQREIAPKLGKSYTWVKDVLRWDPARHSGASSPFARDASSNRRDSVEQAEAKKVLRDPEKRAKVIESLTEMERIEIAGAAMEPSMREAQRTKKEMQAVRDARPARERGVIELISSLLNSADLNIQRAAQVASETTWDDPEVNAMAEGRVDRTAMRLDLLRSAIRSEGDIAAELAKIEEQT